MPLINQTWMVSMDPLLLVAQPLHYPHLAPPRRFAHSAAVIGQFNSILNLVALFLELPRNAASLHALATVGSGTNDMQGGAGLTGTWAGIHQDIPRYTFVVQDDVVILHDNSGQHHHKQPFQISGPGVFC
jgi:hypothetical protein